MSLPCYDFVHNRLLFAGCATQINPRGFDALMSHEVGKERDVVELIQKVFGEAVTKRVGIDHLCIYAILFGVVLQLLGNSPRRDFLAETVQKKKTGSPVRHFQPFQRFGGQLFRDIQSPQLPAFRVQVEVSRLDVFNLDLHKFANPCACRRQIPDHEIPFHVAVFLQGVFEERVIGVADNVLQESFLLNLDEFELEFFLAQKLKVFVHSLYPQVDGLGLVFFHEIALVRQQVLRVHRAVVRQKIIDRPQIRGDGVLRKIALTKMCFKFFHYILPP